MLDGQRLQPERYSLVPRTLVFLIDEDQILLIKVAKSRGAWAGKLNGIGGHIERGEHPLASARREVTEEAGLTPTDLRLCGVVAIDTQEPTGIGLYVIVGHADASDELSASEEGVPGWYELQSLDADQLVEDLPLLIPRALDAYRGQAPFVALYSFDHQGVLRAQFEG